MKTRKNLLIYVLLVIMFVAFSCGMISTQIVSADGIKTDTFTMVEGASIRLKDPSGIRFRVKLGETQYEALTAQNSNQSLHMLIVPETYYAEYLANKGDESCYEYLSTKYTSLLTFDIPTNKLFQKADMPEDEQLEEGYYYAHGVIQELHFNSYANDFVGIAYITTTEGENVTYQDATITTGDPARSAYEIAMFYYEKYQDKTVFEDIIDISLYYKAGVRLGTDDKYYVKGEEGTKYETLVEVKQAVGDFSLTATAVDDIIFVGEETSISAIMKAGETAVSGVEFTYTSLADSVATVDKDGKITAVGVGTAEIIVTCAKAYSTTVTINVINGDFLAQNMMSYWVKRADVGVEWDSVENAVKLTTYAPANSIHTGIYSLRLPMLNEYYELGYRTFAFKVKVDDNAVENGVSIGAHLMNPNWTSSSSIDVIKANEISATEYATAIINLEGNSIYEGQYNVGFSNDGLLQFEIKGSASIEKPSVLYLKDFAPIVQTKGTATLDAGEAVSIMQGFQDTLTPTLTVGGNVGTDTFTYETSNPNVVTVDSNGQITGVTVGMAKILVSAPEYGVSDIVDITVKTNDIFVESMVNIWSPQTGISREWDATENAMKVVSTCKQTNTSTSIIYISLPYIREYFEAGYLKFTFESKVDATALANGVYIDSLTLNPGWVSGCGHTLAQNTEMSADGYVKHTIDFTGAKIEQYFLSEEGLRDDGWFGIIINHTTNLVSETSPSTVWLKNFQPVG